MKADDHSVDSQQLARIREQARIALKAADALGCFPTPVDEVIAAAKHTVAAPLEIDDGFLAKMQKKAGRAGKALRSALSKVWGVLDVAAKLVHLDKLVPAYKVPFLKLHELGHGLLPWQRDIYAVTADCAQTIDPEVSEIFERESNAFACEVLFQLDSFTVEAADSPFGLRTPLDLSKKYGASVYASVRRYVGTNARACAVVVLDPPELVSGDGFRATVRRVITSQTFTSQFGEIQLPDTVTPSDQIGRMVPVGGRKMSRPQALVVNDRNGTRHECVAEAFSYKYYVFVLIYPQFSLTKKILLVTR